MQSNLKKSNDWTIKEVELLGDFSQENKNI